MKRKIGTLTLVLLVAFIGALYWPTGTSKSQTTDVTLIGAGDVADGFDLQLAPAFATAALLDANPTATVFANGDLAYDEGEDRDFMRSYDATWGRARARTIPVPGNHEYNIQQGAGYFSYWGPAAGNPSSGYYSLDLGAWHIIVLNSNCGFVGCAAGGQQETWLKNDLATHTQLCTLALWHEPMYTSSTVIVPATDMQPMWQDLYNFNADLIVNGHAHNYERFAPQDPNGNLDTARGIIEIVAGTGGDSHFPFNATMAPNSVTGDANTYGVLKLTLHASSFDWQFIPIAGQTYTDSGTQACH
jgi:calcineurin-like phosphoesterase family protein